jgi:beta-glucanase (GH16 family)
MKNRFLAILCCGLILLAWSCRPARPTVSGNTKMHLVWSDEFNYTGLPDTTRWGYDLADGCPSNCGWGNNELQYYTANRKENARVENGHLVIEARKETMGKKEYTSSRMVSKHKGDWTHGRMEISAKLPKGLGVWPAIWMLPTDWAYGGWPSSGEIDIMENVGYLPDSVFSSIHTKGRDMTKGVLSKTLSTEFHVYAMEWNAEKMDFFFDGQLYMSFPNVHAGWNTWPFDRKFHMLLNLAVGGNWGGKKGVDKSIWPQQMLVDYVRVYQ